SKAMQHQVCMRVLS
ncbi:Pyruvate dehydrogenase E1 component, partial [Haemophilus influenzae]